MASDATPVLIPATSPVHGSQIPTTGVVQTSGKTLPPTGTTVTSASAEKPADSARANVDPPHPTLQAQVALLNKYLNDSGKPDQFRVDPTSNAKMIQEINPQTGAVVAQYPVAEFPALARSVGVSGALVNSLV